MLFQDICVGIVTVLCFTAIAKTTNYDPIKDSIILLKEAKTELTNLKGTATDESDTIPFTNGEQTK